MAKNTIKTPLAPYAKNAYLSYAMSVVKGRAIPDVEDGMIPVQRRILYSMHTLGLNASSNPTKSARVVGDVLGLYHPHGDNATYGAMVRMAQPFSFRYPLVHGEGNFGSRDGDNAAAYRYTEAKLTPLAEALLSELKWDTVDYQPNYDGKEKEPFTLPARLPFLLLNGAIGIGVGLATNFPPHQLNEVAEGAKLLLQKPNTTLDELMKVIPGPDFPAGGQIISSSEEIYQTYAEGKGKVRVRARWTIEEREKEKILVFYEIPQNTNTEKVLEEIEELVDPKQREKDGKKSALTTEQTRLKKVFNEFIDTFDNHSDQNNPVRIVITPKTKKVDLEQLALALCAHTSLEGNYPINFVAVDSSGAPKQGTILTWLSQWCAYRVETVRRRTQDAKNRLDARLHILNGRLTILDKIQEVIQVLASSDNPKEELKQRYNLDDIQSDDVLDMKLRQIARLEKTKIIDEKNEITPEIQRLGNILANDSQLTKLIIKEIEQDAKTFGDTRKTLIKHEENSSLQEVTQEIVADKAANEPIAIALSERGWVSWKPYKENDVLKSEDFKFKAGDNAKQMFAGNRGNVFLMIDEFGRGYCLQLSELSSRSDSVPLNTLFELKGRMVWAVLSDNNSFFVLAGNHGYGFIIKTSDWVNRMKAGKAILTLKQGEYPLQPLPIKQSLLENTVCSALTSDNKIVSFKANELSVLAKGKGLAFMKIPAGVQMIDFILSTPESGAVSATTTEKKTVVVPAEFLGSTYGTRDPSKKGKVFSKEVQLAYFNKEIHA